MRKNKLYSAEGGRKKDSPLRGDTVKQVQLQLRNVP